MLSKHVLIGFPPERWSGGHLLVLRGGDRSSVYLADSSRLNMQKMAHKDFLKYWAGFAVIVMPQGK
jgi:ABC-type bacteriocin/lantibiotic exporter with double-glycine peptidase domain